VRPPVTPQGGKAGDAALKALKNEEAAASAARKTAQEAAKARTFLVAHTYMKRIQMLHLMRSLPQCLFYFIIMLLRCSSVRHELALCVS
jgi:hypothetical protein